MVQSIIVTLRKRPTGPQISNVSPAAAIPGGEFQIRGTGLSGEERPIATFGGVFAPVVIGSESLLIVKVPEGALDGKLSLGASEDVAWTCDIGIQIADDLHPVANPVVDVYGNIYATKSGTEDARIGVQDRVQPAPARLGDGRYERHGAGPGFLRAALRIQPS